MKKYKNNAELFADGRRSLLGHLSIAVWSFLLYIAFMVLLNQIGSSFTFSNRVLTLVFSLLAGYVTSLFGSLFGIGLSSVFLNLQYNQPASISNLFIAFLENPDRSVRIRSFVTLGEYLSLIPLRLLLFFIPAESLYQYFPLVLVILAVSCTAFIWWNITYAMVNYLMLDFPDISAGKIIRASYKMMHGNRIRLLFLFIRVLPLHLLGIFSIGLANIWAGCCQQACSAAFYKDMMQA